MTLSLRVLLILAEGVIQNGVRKKEVIVLQTMSCVRLRSFPLFVLKHFRIELSCTFYDLIPNAWPKNRNGELRCIFIMNSRHRYAQLWQNDETTTLNWQTIDLAQFAEECPIPSDGNRLDEGRKPRQQRTLAELSCVTIKSNDKAGVHILEVARAAGQDSFGSTKLIDAVRDATFSKLQLIH